MLKVFLNAILVIEVIAVFPICFTPDFLNSLLAGFLMIVVVTSRSVMAESFTCFGFKPIAHHQYYSSIWLVFLNSSQMVACQQP